MQSGALYCNDNNIFLGGSWAFWGESFYPSNTLDRTLKAKTQILVKFFFSQPSILTKIFLSTSFVMYCKKPWSQGCQSGYMIGQNTKASSSGRYINLLHVSFRVKHLNSKTIQLIIFSYRKLPLIGPSTCKQKNTSGYKSPGYKPPSIFLVSLTLNTLTDHYKDELWASFCFVPVMVVLLQFWFCC